MVKKFVLKKVSTVKTKAEARSLAIDYQDWFSEQSLSWGDVARYGNYFSELGKKFKLTKEFKENGII